MLVAFSAECAAANFGRITGIHFAGQGYGDHPNVVQMTLEGGFSGGACNTTFAAIRAADRHLIAFAITAYTTGASVNVVLNQSDLYHSNRCVISYIYALE
jgi:hypothetical protein